MAGTPFNVGDRITLKKVHPCGGREWDVYRIGADIGLKCLNCERRVMLTRKEVERRMIARAIAEDDGEQPG
ncbi:MAG: DUF951 domain-containing protein [Chloroflexi bacterium]|nr:DUF951 domain-containing protein [Chloroflexota bacterium]MCI0803074.1 DUF951 domain-containing protein [Chloroflexota bacterium]MCI0807674.1 DUF951 domain-containing protein [Chloroflexota bacterium]MCI0834010.1 DUF951 domain-containing protein [Chloroflexota bacterium]MCI0836439.1 DUF951 domain-containing protein [Chloroflexota bacterium]